MSGDGFSQLAPTSFASGAGTGSGRYGAERSSVRRSPCHSAYGFSPNTTIATSGFDVKCPSGLNVAEPPAAATAALMPAKIDVPPGKSAFELPVPCHDTVQPP